MKKLLVRGENNLGAVCFLIGQQLGAVGTSLGVVVSSSWLQLGTIWIHPGIYHGRFHDLPDFV